MVKHVSKLEKEKLAALASEKESFQRVQRSLNHCDSKDGESLGNTLRSEFSSVLNTKSHKEYSSEGKIQ